jgi:hypothetical protein
MGARGRPKMWVYCSHGNCDIAAATMATASISAEHFFDSSIGSEAFINPKGFERAVWFAAARLTHTRSTEGEDDYPTHHHGKRFAEEAAPRSITIPAWTR